MSNILLKSLRRFLRSSKSVLIFEERLYSSATSIKNDKFDTQLIPETSFEQRLLKVAIIGVPNAGKSTFINNLMDRKVCATSSKVHTTRTKSQAIFTVNDAQIIFVDTPGLVNFQEHRKYKLQKSFLKDTKGTLQHNADIIGVVHDASNPYTRDRLDIKVIKLLTENQGKPSFLVLNKIDILKSKRKLLDLTRILTDNCLNGKPIAGPKLAKEKGDLAWPNFEEIFMVSALTGSGLEEVKNYLIERAKPGKWMYPENVWSDQSAEDIITNCVKAKLLDFLPQEIPYQLNPQMEFFDIDEKGIISTVVLINCPSSRIAKLVGGASDGKLRQITESVQNDLQDAFQNYVKIKLQLHFPEK